MASSSYPAARPRPKGTNSRLGAANKGKNTKITTTSSSLANDHDTEGTIAYRYALFTTPLTMGALDVYCAICGGPFAIPLEHLETPFTTTTDTKAVLRESLAWLRELRVIVRNPESRRAYITGPGHSENYGWVRVAPGTDPNAPALKRGDAEDGRVSMAAYCDWGGMGGGDEWVAPFPVHCRCLEVLERAHAARRRGARELDVERLRLGMEGLLRRSARCLAGMEYGELGQREGEDIWEDGEEVRARLPWLLDPTAPVLLDLPHEIPAVTSTQNNQAWYGHPLASLPTELLHQTLDQLPSAELLNLLEAFPAASQRLDGHFWRRRIERDMPYLYEMGDIVSLSSLHEQAVPIDWARLYQRLLDKSYPSLGAKGIEVFGREECPSSAASRRRVWQCAEQLLDAADVVDRSKL